MRTNSITLVGMSNVGKSHWAPRLEPLGFKRIWCDDEIEKRLGPELERLGYRGIQNVAKWMGQPFDTRYHANAATYLHYEVEVMQDALARLASGERLVIDTTGSVIYTGGVILWALMQQTMVVLLDAPRSLREELYRKYIAEPKPVIWGDGTYCPIPDEMPMEGLRRCYPDLLKTRNQRYHAIANKVLGYHTLRTPGFTARDFLREVGLAE